MRIHIESDSDNIHISGSLAISKQRSLHPVCSCQKGQFRICHTASAVIVRVNGQYDTVTVFHVFAHIFDLACVHVRHGELNGDRKIDDDFPVRRRLPDVQDRIAHFQRIFHFGSGETLRRVFELEIPFCLVCQLFQEFGAVRGNL